MFKKSQNRNEVSFSYGGFRKLPTNQSRNRGVIRGGGPGVPITPFFVSLLNNLRQLAKSGEYPHFDTV